MWVTTRERFDEGERDNNNDREFDEHCVLRGVWAVFLILIPVSTDGTAPQND